MSQLVLDDQLDLQKILPGLQDWIRWVRLQTLRPGEVILDDRVCELLRSEHRPTFITIDRDFWDRKLCHARYCILYFALATAEQERLPGLLRRVLRLEEFHTRAARMGKVARVQQRAVTYWEAGAKQVVALPAAADR